MAVKTKAELLESIKAKFGDDTGDDTLAVLEDISDTFDNLEDAAKDTKDWKAEAEHIDADWRKKYHDRFFSGENIDEPDEDPAPNSEVSETLSMSFDNLFKEE